MKKLIAFVLILSVCLCSCAKKQQPVSVVTTSFAAYDWARQIVGDQIDKVTLTLIGQGSKPHSYTPTEQDITLIKNCDIFIYVGDEKWASDIDLKESAQSLCFLDSLDSELLQSTKSGAVDSHVWLSIQNAQILSNLVCNTLKLAIPQKELVFADNLERLALQLVSLDREYRAVMQNEQNGTVLVCDKFPFKYLFCDYNVGWYSAFSDCTESNEVSADTITALAKAIDEQRLKNVVTTEFSGDSLAKAVILKTADQNVGVVTLNSMQTADINSTYVEIAKNNLNALKQAFETR